ncbi:MAG: WD40 repeat domain-containing protein [Pirellulales bacterium]|nr:WD40 repeat domain-containing protein [Pirellulales bacterium]
MKDEHPFRDFESLEPPLEAAVKAAIAVPIPEDAIERVKLRAKRLATNTVSPYLTSSSLSRRWKVSRPLVAGMSAAAALLVIVTAGFWLLNQSGGQAFAQMIEKVKAASSVHFITAIRSGKGPETKAVVYVEGNRIRSEEFNSTTFSVADLDQKQLLIVDMADKRAHLIKLDADLARTASNPIDKLRRMKSDDAEQIGETRLKGRRTQVYRCRKIDAVFCMPDGEMLVWVDVESGLPAKIEIRSAVSKTPIDVRFDEFVWNEPLDARLFSLAIPEGFEEVPRETPKPLVIREAYMDNPNYLTDGVLSRDRVAATVVWDSQGKTITALMRDPESVPQIERFQGELRQWDVATGRLRWAVNRDVPRTWTQTADGKTLATVYKLEVELRDSATGNITRKWGTDELISHLAFSPDGKTLAAGIGEWGKYGGRGGKRGGGVQFWDVARGTLVRTIKSDDTPVSFVGYSPDGSFLTTSAESTVKLWDVWTGRLARIFPGIRQAAFSPDGRTIACQAASPMDKTANRIDLYNVRDGTLAKSFTSEKGASASLLTCITFSPNGHLLAASDRNGSVTLWDVATGERRLTIADHRADVISVAFAPDGATLATGSEDKTLRLRKLPAELIRPALEKR